MNEFCRRIVNIGILIVILMTAFSLYGKWLNSEITPVSGEQTVDAVWYHENNDYSVSYIKNGKLITGKPWGIQYNKIEIVPDLRHDNQPYVEWNYYINKADVLVSSEDGESFVRIHIRGIDDLSGAGWNHGKFGQGMTVRFQ